MRRAGAALFVVGQTLGATQADSRLRVRASLMTVAVLGFLVLAAITGVGLRGAFEVKPSDYDAERQQVQAKLTRLEQAGEGARFRDLRSAIEYLALRERHAMLTGTDDDVTRLQEAIARALAEFGPADGLLLFRASLECKLHRVDAARDSLESITEPGYRDAVHTLAADIAVQEGRYDDAARAYQSLLASTPTWDREARLAHLRLLAGDVNAAERLYHSAQEKLTAKEMRQYAWLELQLGLLHLNHGRLQEAQQHYEKADRAYSGFWLIHEHMAELLGVQGRFDDASALFRRVVDRVPKPELYHELGDLYLFRGKVSEASFWHAKALAGYVDAVRRGQVHYYHHLATFYADVRQDGREALKWAQKDMALRPNVSARDALAWALYRDGQFDRAVKEMEAALGTGIQDAHLFFHAGMIYLAAQHPEKGKHWLKRAAELNPYVGSFHVHRS